ncbi:hypothetical protein [Kineococcus rhizosphaerae]|uniref:PE family protein n=1 Tax=Kineococcus rhizosphaerae TaxID=559628 RepID=A0A2T0R1D0_9ACTN|nr:hypothetical protein [Kineococcus rhizosphaerae]PRY13378.1 hypothetical protein CLV37_10846 [Kineococcus rhizosphaerae]
MTDLRLDTTVLLAASRRLAAVADALAPCTDPVVTAASATPSPVLAEALRSFADDSTRHRRLLADDARTLGRQLGDSAAALDQVEAGLAGAVSGDAGATP